MLKHRSPELIRRINFGCGPHHALEDWWNVDIHPFPGVDEVMDATQPWSSKGLELVYAEHFLEHLEPQAAIAFLRNALDALEIGGRIRLTTPSLEWVMKTHFTFSADADEERRQTLVTNRAFHGWGHRFLYSKAILEWVVTGVGFQQVEFFDYGVSGVKHLEGIERHGNYSVSQGYPSVWIIEGVRASETRRVHALEAFFEEHFGRHVPKREG